MQVTPPAVSEMPGHTMHSYFNTSPESPDGCYVLYYGSTDITGHAGEIRIRERATGRETVLARDVTVEDAHRAACQQWTCGGAQVVFHNVLENGEWGVVAVDIESGRDRCLARGRQLGFGQPSHHLVPLYGPHWEPGDHRGLELLNVETGAITQTALTPETLADAWPEWLATHFGRHPVSVFFPLLSPDLTRVLFKIATPAGGDFRSRSASRRRGLFCYDLAREKFLFRHEKWGHPAWHPDSRRIIRAGGLCVDSDTGKTQRIAAYPSCHGDHPSFSPDGECFATDTTCRGEAFKGPEGWWAVLVGNACTGDIRTIDRFDNSRGARSWRPSHPHPVFSPDGRRLYFNVSNGKWTKVCVAPVPAELNQSQAPGGMRFNRTAPGGMRFNRTAPGHPFDGRRTREDRK